MRNLSLFRRDLRVVVYVTLLPMVYIIIMVVLSNVVVAKGQLYPAVAASTPVPIPFPLFISPQTINLVCFYKQTP